MAKKTIYSREYRQLVERLREARETLGLSQTELSQILGWPQQRMSTVEIGSRRLDVMEYFQLTRALGLSPEQALSLIPSTDGAR